mgnify:FL=1
MLNKETLEMLDKSISADVKSLNSLNLDDVDIDKELKTLNAIKIQQDIVNQNIEMKQKQSNAKWNRVKDILTIAIPVVGQIVSLVMVGSLRKKIAGSDRMMTYQDSLMTPKTLKDGEKFLTGISSKLI